MTISRLFGTLLGVIGVGLLAYLMSRGTAAYDWIITYYPTATAFLEGSTRLYDPPAMATQYYYPPWSLLLLLGPAMLGSAPGLVVFRMASVVAFALVALNACPKVRFRPLLVALAAGSLYTVDVIALGQTSAFVALGIWLAWWAIEGRQPAALVIGLALMTTKPHLAALPAILVLAGLRAWPVRLRLRAAAWMAGLLGLSVAISGLDWPLRWLHYVVNEMPPPADAIVSLYRLGKSFPPAETICVALAAMTIAWLALRLWRDGPSRPMLLLATTASITLSPFVRDYDYSIAMVLVWPALAVGAPVLAAAAYLLHLALYVQVQDNPQLLLLHPVVALLLLAGAGWLYVSREKQQEQTDQRDEAEESIYLAAGEPVGEQRVEPGKAD